MLVNSQREVACIFDAESHIKQTDSSILVEICHATQCTKKGILVCVRVEWSDGLACGWIHKEDIAHGKGVVTACKRSPSYWSEIDKSVTYGLESRVEGMTHWRILQEEECVHLLCARADGQQSHEGCDNILIRFHCSALLIVDCYCFLY